MSTDKTTDPTLAIDSADLPTHVHTNAITPVADSCLIYS